MSHTIVPVLGEATNQELRESVRGNIVATGDSGYDEASRIWNGGAALIISHSTNRLVFEDYSLSDGSTFVLERLMVSVISM